MENALATIFLALLMRTLALVAIAMIVFYPLYSIFSVLMQRIWSLIH